MPKLLSIPLLIDPDITGIPILGPRQITLSADPSVPANAPRG